MNTCKSFVVRLALIWIVISSSTIAALADGQQLPSRAEVEAYAKDLRQHFELLKNIDLKAKRPIAFPITTERLRSSSSEPVIGVFDSNELRSHFDISADYARNFDFIEPAIQKAIQQRDLGLINNLENKRIEKPYLEFAMWQGDLIRRLCEASPETPIIVSRQSIMFVRDGAEVRFIDLQPKLQSILQEFQRKKN